jgi:transcriptional regulator with XRE-family HTH domain
MTHGRKAARPVETVARRVREVRRRRGLSAAQLAERLQQVGLDWDRNIVANLENGRRASLSVDELLALALVLDVAPVHLLVPLEDEQPYQVTPTRVEPAGVVRDLIRGADALAGMDGRAFFSEVPEHEWLQVTEHSRTHRGERLGTYRDRQEAKTLAYLDQRAADGDPEAQRIAASLAGWRKATERATDG